MGVNGMTDRYQRTVVRCSECGEEIGRGENLGFTSAVCAKCGAELFPQFKKDPVPPPEPFVFPRQSETAPVILQDLEPKAPDNVAISVYEGEESKSDKPKKKKPAAKKTKGKSVVKAIKSLTRLK